LETLAVKVNPVWLTVAVLVDEHEAARALLLMLSLKFQVPAMLKVVGEVELLPPQAATSNRVAIGNKHDFRIVPSL
jgi:hypothetical protein